MRGLLQKDWAEILVIKNWCPENPELKLWDERAKLK
jgi:hypothetical protein